MQRMNENDYNVSKELDGYRLDVALALLCSELTRTTVKKIIDNNSVSVNGKLEYRRNYKVKEGDVVNIKYESSSKSFESITPQNIPLDVIYEDDDLIAVNKPSGMVVHPASGNWDNTLMNAIVFHYKNIGSIGGKIRSGLIHRLDKDTSGVVLIGKTNRGLWHYSKMFEKRMVEKKYLAIAKGTLEKQYVQLKSFSLEGYISRSKFNRLKMQLTSLDQEDIPSDARYSKTSFEIERSHEKYFQIWAKPETGRTHQIRVHLHHLGIPIVGDEIYGGCKDERLLLHAYSLSIRNLEGDVIILKAPIPREFRDRIISLLGVDSCDFDANGEVS
jgi:23S rRNA pseudouridine1911/1915/1917 synthase